MRRLLVAVIVAAACATVRPSAQAPLNGVVTDLNTGLPIRNATVSQAGKVLTLTDRNGRFQVPPTTGVQLMLISKAGYARMMIQRPPALTDLDVTMIRGSALMVHVLDAEGQPMPGAGVTVRCPNIQATVAANDLGIARVAGLGPMSCEVSATEIPTMPTSSGARPGPDQLRALSESLNARTSQIEASRSGAMRVDLSIGEERSVAIEGPVRRSAPTQSSAPPGGTASIRGRVLSNGRPVSGARVLVSSSGAWSVTTTSNSDGTYAVTGLAAGSVITAASHVGYVQADTNPIARPFELKDGDQIVRDLLLTPGAVITGTIVDAYGDVMEGVRVTATRVADPTSPAIAPPAGASALTDDRGQYRVASLPAGTYQISASVNRSGSAAAYFYPGRPSANEAVGVTVAAATETSGIDFALEADGVPSLSGTVVTSLGTAPSGGFARLARAGENGPVVVSSTPVQRDGRFLFTDIAPGAYALTVSAAPAYVILTRHGGQAVQAPPLPSIEFAVTPVTIASGAPAVTSVRTAPAALLRGRVTIDDPGGGVTLSTLHVVTATDRTNSVQVASDGTFELRGVPGATRIDLTSVPSGWWVRAVMVGGVNAADEPIDLSTQSSSRDDVRVVVARSARIAGIVTEATARAPIRVIALPVERDRRYAGSRYLRTTTAGADGRYALGVPPGQYLVVALTSMQPLSDDVMAQLEPLATRVSATEARESRVDVRAVRLTP